MKQGKKSYAVFGMGEFGKSVAIELAKNGADVMAIDDQEDALADVTKYVTDARLMDASDARAYEKIGLDNMDAVVIGITENMDATLMAILQSVEAGVKDIIVKAISDTQVKIFSRIGATQIITPEKSEGIRLARIMSKANIFEFIEFKDDICMLEISIKDEWVGKSLVELNLRNKYHINVIALLRDGHANMAVDPNMKLHKGEHLLIVIDKENIARLS